MHERIDLLLRLVKRVRRRSLHTLLHLVPHPRVQAHLKRMQYCGISDRSNGVKSAEWLCFDVDKTTSVDES